VRNAAGTIVWMGRGRRLLDVVRVVNGRFAGGRGAARHGADGAGPIRGNDNPGAAPPDRMERNTA